MSVKCFWDEQRTDCYRVEMHDEWEWQDFREAIKTSYEMLGKSTTRMDLVMGFYTPFPEGTIASPHMMYAGNQPTTIRHTVILNATGRTNVSMMESIIPTLAKMKGWEGPKFVNAMEEARAHFAALEDDQI